MKLAILHYHLNRSGVTQVVVNQLRALQTVAGQLQLSDVLVLHGGRADGWPDTQWPDAFRVRVESVDGLDYEDSDELRDITLTDSIILKLEQFGFAPHETILHIHNHSLGKNVSVPGTVRNLAEREFRILLQIHDFAEDLRPANYAKFPRALDASDSAAVGRYVYPIAEHIHYALLNSRDRRIILDAGAENDRVHCLPNPVTAAGSLPAHEQSLRRFQQIHGLTESQRVVLYPVRGIRRKNIGELLLWAAATDEDTVFALTLPATSEAEVPAFQQFQELAQRLELRVLFDVGLNEGISFEENLAAASCIITTSVAEGFGLVFLEAWLHQRPLIGRNLPEITADFADRNVKLDHLGESVQIPIDWIEADRFVAQVLTLQSEVSAGYGQAMPASTESTIRERIASGQVDFAALPTARQAIGFERVATDGHSAEILFDLNPWMRDSVDRDPGHWQPLIASNEAAVRSGFSLGASARDIQRVYQALLDTPADQPVAAMPSPENILNAFLDITRLAPVRVEP